MNRIVESLYSKYGLNESLNEDFTDETRIVGGSDDTMTIEVDWVVNDVGQAIKDVESSFNLKVIDVQDNPWMDIALIQGTKEELCKYLMSDLYGMDIVDIEKVYPELVE